MPKHKDWTTLHSHIVEDLKVMSLSKTALKHKLNISTLWNYCKKNNIEIIRAKSQFSLRWDAIHDKIVQDFETMSMTEVAEKYNLPYPTLYKYCKRNNINAQRNKFRKRSSVYVDWEAIHETLLQDLSMFPISTVAKKHKLRYSTLLYYCKRNNLTFFTVKYSL